MDGKVLTRFESGAIIIHSEEDRVRMRDLDRDQGNTCVRNLIRNDGCDLLLDLKFDDQVHPVSDKLLRIADRRGGVVVVVEDHQIHAGRCRGGPEALGHCLRERQGFRLASEAETYFSRTGC